MITDPHLSGSSTTCSGLSLKNESTALWIPKPKLGSLFLKPLWLLDTIILLFAILFYFYSPIISAVLGSILAFDILCLVYTIACLEDKKTFIKAIFHFPAFIVMWLRGFVLAFQKSPWRRARE